MRRTLSKVAVLLVFVLIMMTGTLVGGVLLLAQPAQADCVPSAVNVSDKTVKVGGGPAVDAYFRGLAPGDANDRKANAALIIQIGRARKFSDRSIAIAVATSLQESGLRNLSYGDRDSLGLFQQRPSVGVWGTAAQILNPTHAINAFDDRLVRIPDRDRRPMIDVAIQIQVPSIIAYRSTWHWDTLATELVTGSDTGAVCATEAGSGNVKLPLNPGYYVSAPFNDPNYVGTKPHDGIDLAYRGGSLGKPVFAVRDGLVIQSGKGRGCSGTNDVIIKHADGTETGYLHMNGSDITVAQGDHVTAGQQIGRANECGFATGPHLHFEVLPGTDKAPWITGLAHAYKYGKTFVDPIGYMAHFGVKLVG